MTSLKYDFVMKWVSLLILATSSLGFSICFRYARLQPGKSFSNLTAVVSSEVIKFISSIVMMWAGSGSRVAGRQLMNMCWKNWRGSLLMGVPGVLYAAQNFLFFVAISNLSVTLYQITKQLTILTTAVLWVFALGGDISRGKWVALVMLVVGVVLVSVKGDVALRGSLTIGLACSMTACMLSGLASVFTESMIKKGGCSVWERNVQLSVFGIVFGSIGILTSEADMVASQGFFGGYSSAVVGVILLQSIGGMVTASVLKYADSVMKCVVKSLVVGVSAILSRILFSEGPPLDNPQFIVGMTMTLAGVTWYSLGSETTFGCCPCLGHSTGYSKESVGSDDVELSKIDMEGSRKASKNKSEK